MKLKILSLLLILGLMVNVGCTSSNDESPDSEAADAADTDEEGEEVVEGEESGEEEVAEEGAEESDDFATDEEVVADAGEEEAVADGTAEESVKPTDDVATSEELPAESLEETGDGSQIVAEDGTGMEGTELADGSVSESPAAEEGVFDNTSSEAPAETASAYTGGGYEEAPKTIPVKKIADTPFNKNGMLLNTVYLARSGDDINSISQKIFGSDNSASLLQANPNLAKGVKVGDKVYYNSPKRSQDSQRMLTYYEDNGLVPQSYVAKSGDNIRKISKNLLGDSSSWKEVWATNMAVDSKDELAEGTELRYWPEGSMPVAAAAPAPEFVAEAPPAPEAPQMPEPVTEAPIIAGDPSQAPAAGDDFALPDDMANAGAAGTVANEPPPPPPPPTSAPQKSVASNDEKDLTFMLSAGGLLLVGVGVLLGIIRKGRSRKMSMNTHTQI